jgi:outer membrane protein insertion porin family
LKSLFKSLLCAFCLLLALAPMGWAQLSTSIKVAKIEIKHVGPQSVSDELIRSNIRVKVGDTYPSGLALAGALDDDVKNLYATGLFYNIQIAEEMTPEGINLTYLVQPNPRLVDIKFQGNHKFAVAKLSKKISSKVGDPLLERKLFSDTEEIKKMYQKSGYPRTEVRYVIDHIDENAGRGSVTFEINESPKIKIVEVDFVGAEAFSQRKLRKVVKTRRHWMWSWITGHGFLKEDQLEEDKEKLADFYREHGYIDYELKDVQFLYPTPRKMVVHFVVYEGRQYKVGSVTFSGNKVFSKADITNGLHRAAMARAGKKVKAGPNGLPMDVGDTFTPEGLQKDSEAVEDYYGSKGYIDVTPNSRNLVVEKIPNTETGTMDLGFRIEEGQKSYIEKIDIRGNTRTKDKVIRRELAVSPGEPFDMVRVRLSKQRLEGLQFFDKVDARPEPTDAPNRRNLVIGVDEKRTGNLTLGAGFSSVDAVVGFVELYQGNFDLFHPPTFTGGGQKFRLRVQMGTERQDYVMSFIEPWFLGRKLSLGVDLYYRRLGFESVGGIYDVVRAGGKVSLTRALGSEFLIGGVSYTLEDVGILLHSDRDVFNTPQDILSQDGYHLLSRVGSFLAWDTRNSVQLPDHGQRTELDGEVVTGDDEFYKLELKTAWYFRGFVKGHVLELVGRTGAAESLHGHDVPFFERYYLGGLYSLRGFRYRGISPRQTDPFGVFLDEPVGGDTYWFGSAEYSIPIFEQERGVGVRFALFYDIGNVASQPYRWKFSEFNDNWGVGLRLNLPIGPLRLDYGIPIHHDQFNSGSGHFQFGVGYTREF